MPLRLTMVLVIAAAFDAEGLGHAFAQTRIAIVSQDSGSVVQIDPVANKVVTSADVGKGAARIATADGRLLYLSYPDRRSIGVFDSQAGRLVRSIAIEGEPFGIAAGTHALFVSDWSRNVVSRIDLEAADRIDVVAVGKSPADMALDASRQRLYVADRDDNDVSVIDTATMRKVSAIPTGVAPFALALAPDGQRLYVANVHSDDLTVIDTLRMVQIATVPAGSAPYGVAVTPDASSILVTNQHSASLSVIDAERLTVSATIPVGRYPEGVIASSDGRAYVVNWFSGDVSVVDLAGRREIQRVKVGEGPRNLVSFTRE